MAMGRPKAVLVLDAEQREQLESLANSRALPAGLVRRAKIILLSASGKTNREVAGQMETSKVTVGVWRRRFLAHGVRGLYDELRTGRPRPISDERVAQLVRKTLKSKPPNSTHWSIRQIAGETGVSKSTVHRIWQAFGLQPHRQKYFKLSGDPFFVEKVRDIVGLYLNSPENAVVLCVDEKSGIQALERTQPMLPLGLGYVEGMTHDYRRQGTTTLFAALDAANGKVLTPCRPRHRHQEYLSFLREIEKNVPENLDVHIIVDNYATHKHLRVRRRFRTRPRFPCALHSDLFLLAQSGGNLVQSHHATSHSPRDVPQCEGTGRENRSLRPEFQSPGAAIRLDRQPIRFSVKSNDYVKVFPGQHTSA